MPAASWTTKLGATTTESCEPRIVCVNGCARPASALLSSAGTTVATCLLTSSLIVFSTNDDARFVRSDGKPFRPHLKLSSWHDELLMLETSTPFETVSTT